MSFVFNLIFRFLIYDVYHNLQFFYLRTNFSDFYEKAVLHKTY